MLGMLFIWNFEVVFFPSTDGLKLLLLLVVGFPSFVLFILYLPACNYERPIFSALSIYLLTPQNEQSFFIFTNILDIGISSHKSVANYTMYA